MKNEINILWKDFVPINFFMGKFQCRGVLLIWMKVGQGPIALAAGAVGVVWTFLLSSIFSLFLLPLCGRRPDID